MRLAAAAAVSALCLAALPPPAAAASPAPTMTADQLVAKNLDARGGAAKIGALRSLRMTGRLELGSGDRHLQAAWAQIQKRPGMIRTETTLQGLTQVETYDGKDAWTLDPFEGRRDAQRDSADDARIRARDADIEGPLVHWREKGHRVEYMGTEDVDGTPAHKLRVSFKDGDTQYLFLDPDYFLEIRIETVSHVRGTERISEADLGSYEQVDGLWIPFSIEAGRKGPP
ncbi:MAG: outer membrane lipoprotein-sorting protein, partial [Acidobacteriota bacterium]|nr:outer membrane lipoprotein-sorting protein [Acidobacteriota bacterium]